VQERLPGATITDPGAEAIVAMNDRVAGNSPTGRMFHHQLRLPPTDGLLEQYDARSRRLLDRIKELHAGSNPAAFNGDDLVHPDLTVPNLLCNRSGEVTGVVDWNLGVARGDRRFGLVKLLFDLTWASRPRPRTASDRDSARPDRRGRSRHDPGRHPARLLGAPTRSAC
jgi:hypothetical protein